MPLARRRSALLAVAALCGPRPSTASVEPRSLDTCHEPGTCPPTGRAPARSGLTNGTGWAPDGSGCCDICEGAKRVNCFDKATCGAKTGKDDWDFLVLDQIWLPQLCTALAHGHDPTLTHTERARCLDGASRTTGLSIHGLWPNYVGGFPQCCERVALPQELQEDTLEQAGREWVDPTTAVGDRCGVCSMWAHEMMKHGACMTTSMDSYMRTTLGLLARLQERTAAANELLSAASRGPIATRKLKDVYLPFSAPVLCDSRDPGSNSSVGVFLELQTCWNRTSGRKASGLVQIDCPGKPVGLPCPELLMASGARAPESVLVL